MNKPAGCFTQTLIGKLVVFQMPYHGKSGTMRAAGRILAILPDGRLDIRLQSGGYHQIRPEEIVG
jgi:hypothetical protein